MQLREYQQRAVASVRREWEQHDSVLLVLPTGGGKTLLGQTLAAPFARVLWVAHRRELVAQAAKRLEAAFGAEEVGIIAAGYPAALHAKVQVATIQTLLKREALPPADLVVFDEAHHYLATDWNRIAHYYRHAKKLGLTATPERQDGRALGDLFNALVVGAHYSELLRDGFLVPCVAYQPPEMMGSDLASMPVDAYQRHAEGSRAFLFVSGKSGAYSHRDAFNAAGVAAAVIEANTPKDERAATLVDFEAGDIRVISNINTMTEGVDIPSARTVIVARNCDNVGTYLQMAGRVLRPHPDKQTAIIIDLTGATIKHGLPTEDRIYSLSGEPIRRTETTQLRQCPACGAVAEGRPSVCPSCGYVFPVMMRNPPKIYDLELRKVYAGEETPDTAKQNELIRLLTVAHQKGFSCGWAATQYKLLFGVKPDLGFLPNDIKAAELRKLQKFASDKGYKPGWAAYRYKDTFGGWPSLAVVTEAKAA